MRHSKVALASEENVKFAVLSLVGPLGPESIVVCGAIVSTVKLRCAGVASGLPRASTARTRKLCGPSERPV